MAFPERAGLDFPLDCGYIIIPIGMPTLVVLAAAHAEFSTDSYTNVHWCSVPEMICLNSTAESPGSQGAGAQATCVRSASEGNVARLDESAVEW